MTNRTPDCFHCGEAVPANFSGGVDCDGELQPVCCIGCQSVARLIIDSGNGDYYRHRNGTAPYPAALVATGSTALADFDRLYDRFDEPLNQRDFVIHTDPTHAEALLLVDGIYCAACSWLIERSLAALPGVQEISVNPVTRRTRIVWQPQITPLSRLFASIAALGYRPHPLLRGESLRAASAERRAALKRLAVAGFGMMQVMMFAVALYAGSFSGMDERLTGFFRAVSLLVATPVVFYAARPFFISAWRGLRAASLGMDVPVAIAIGGAYAASVVTTLSGGPDNGIYFDSVVMFTFFLSLGRYLEMMARHRAGAAGEALARLVPTTAVVLQHDAGHVVETLTPIGDLRVGDRVRIRPGEPVPADGRVIAGRSSADEALLTGEADAKPKGPGDRLTGGSINLDGPLDMLVEAAGEATLLSGIARLLERAQHERPQLARVADRLAAYFVAAVLLVAAGVGLVWWQLDPARALTVTLAVLVVTCPCALSLATPAALTAATGTLARHGLLVTRGHALEALASIDTVVFDKTGTLTLGQLSLSRTQPLAATSAADCLALAAALERHSEHPVAAAFDGIAVAGAASDIQVVPGAGISGTVNGRRLWLGNADFVCKSAAVPPPASVTGMRTSVLLADEQAVLARFTFDDPLRDGLADTVGALVAAGLTATIASGDDETAVARVARAAGIDNFHAAMKPQDKLALIRKLQRANHRVMMVGDGLNDAPVLAGADVSVATASGTSLAQTSADIVLLGQTLAPLVTGIVHARRTLGVIRQNVGWAIGYNLVALPLAASGHLTPWLAAIGMSFSSLLVVLNALRLTRVRAPGPPGAAVQAAPPATLAREQSA